MTADEFHAVDLLARSVRRLVWGRDSEGEILLNGDQAVDHATSMRLLNAGLVCGGHEGSPSGLTLIARLAHLTERGLSTSPDTVRDRNYSALLTSIYRPAAVAWRP
ncbi:hypothetical protein [Streptomyces sp. NBC_00872]|uniref:hypothetical protein n=1 Tax=Streptomyces sp. NBC_00872 TaxID=2903686 RepID=UPI003867BC6A|nr:hypothetical protein OG214_07555 [Streptomyces sp. NBC_00872]